MNSLGPEFRVLTTGFFETPGPGGLGLGPGESRTGGFWTQKSSLRVVFFFKKGLLIVGRESFGKVP